jgi:hypothetical protein
MQARVMVWMKSWSEMERKGEHFAVAIVSTPKYMLTYQKEANLRDIVVAIFGMAHTMRGSSEHRDGARRSFL